MKKIRQNKVFLILFHIGRWNMWLQRYTQEKKMEQFLEEFLKVVDLGLVDDVSKTTTKAYIVTSLVCGRDYQVTYNPL